MTAPCLINCQQH